MMWTVDDDEPAQRRLASFLEGRLLQFQVTISEPSKPRANRSADSPTLGAHAQLRKRRATRRMRFLARQYRFHYAPDGS
jgi:hypothetical protein